MCGFHLKCRAMLYGLRLQNNLLFEDIHHDVILLKTILSSTTISSVYKVIDTAVKPNVTKLIWIRISKLSKCDLRSC